MDFDKDVSNTLDAFEEEIKDIDNPQTMRQCMAVLIILTIFILALDIHWEINSGIYAGLLIITLVLCSIYIYHQPINPHK